MLCEADINDYKYFYDVQVQPRDLMVGLETNWAHLLTELQFGTLWDSYHKEITGYGTLVVVNVKKEITKIEKVVIEISNYRWEMTIKSCNNPQCED